MAKHKGKGKKGGEESNKIIAEIAEKKIDGRKYSIRIDSWAGGKTPEARQPKISVLQHWETKDGEKSGVKPVSHFTKSLMKWFMQNSEEAYKELKEAIENFEDEGSDEGSSDEKPKKSKGKKKRPDEDSDDEGSDEDGSDEDGSDED